MKKKQLWLTIVLLVLSLCLAVAFVGCDGGDGTEGTGEGETPEKGFTISCPTEMLAGERVEITITEYGDVDLKHDNYEWKIVGENTVVGSFEFEDLDKSDNYTNKFFKAGLPGKVQIQAINKADETYTSNIVEITVTGRTIASVQDLLDIADSDKVYVMTADLDLSHENNWEPIKGFKGVLDGNGHKISNLVIDNFVADLGLFGVLEGTVQNLTIEGVQITARGDAGNAGAVAGTNKGTVSNVTVKGSVAPEYYNNVGGVVGFNDGGKILNCVNEATVKGKEKVGGIVGQMAATVDNALTACQNKGAVTGESSVGGVAGFVTMPTDKGEIRLVISNNENNAAVVGMSDVGGVFGQVFGKFYDGGYSTDYYGYFEMSVLTNTAKVTGDSSGKNVGGIIGSATRLVTLSSCKNTADIIGGACVGGTVGYAPGTNIKATGIANDAMITGKGKVGGFAGHAGVIENAVNNGQIVSTGIIAENGKSHAYVGGVAGYCEGLIGCENNADIEIELNAAYVGGLAGYISAAATNSVNNNVNYGEVNGMDCVGGIAGYLTMPVVNQNKTYAVSNNQNKKPITGNNNVGGIFGEVYGMFYDGGYSTDYYGYFEMTMLTNTARITGSAGGESVGGLIGKATRVTTLSTGENTADVSGGTYVGGWVGYAPTTNIKATGAKNRNAITGRCYVGGFAGYAGLIENAKNEGTVLSTAPNEDGDTYLGGIAGYCTGIKGCTNSADIQITNAGKYIGGIAGYVFVSASNMANDNVNTGAILGGDNVGGIAGYISMPVVNYNLTYAVSNNRNQNTVQGKAKVGGIFGEVIGMFYDGGYSTDYYGYFEVINCTNEAEIKGDEYYGGIVGAYTRMKTDENVMNTNSTTHGDKLGH